MRVLFLSHSAVVPLYREKLHDVVRLGCELHVLLPPRWPEGGREVDAPAEGEERGVKLHVRPGRWIGHVGGFHWQGLGELAQALHPEIIYAEEEPYSLACAQARRAAAAVGARFGFFTWENIYRRYKPPLNWVFRNTVKHTAWAVAGNQEAQDVLRQWGFSGTCRIIPQYGIDPQRFSPLQSKPRRQTSLTIGYVGRLIEAKGLVTLLRAASLLRGAFTLRLLGNGPEQTALQRLARDLGLEDRISFHPAVANEAVPDVLRSLDVLVLPSETRPDWKEQFGRVLVEAMACGVPVIGSSSGEIPRVIGEAGLVFAEGDARDLARQLERLHHDPALAARLAVQGRERVLAQFTTERIAQQTFDLYRDMLEGPPCASR